MYQTIHAWCASPTCLNCTQSCLSVALPHALVFNLAISTDFQLPCQFSWCPNIKITSYNLDFILFSCQDLKLHVWIFIPPYKRLDQLNSRASMADNLFTHAPSFSSLHIIITITKQNHEIFKTIPIEFLSSVFCFPMPCSSFF